MLHLDHPLRWRIAGLLLLMFAMSAALVPELPFWQFNNASEFTFSDKILHMATFAFLMAWFSGQYHQRHYPAIALGLVAFGVLIEVLQSFVPYRTSEWMDLYADGIGIAIGLLIAVFFIGGWTPRVESWLGSRNE